jgi:hypothetical protein
VVQVRKPFEFRRDLRDVLELEGGKAGRGSTLADGNERERHGKSLGREWENFERNRTLDKRSYQG